MPSDSIYFEGFVSTKRSFLWSEKKLTVFGDRVEFLQPDKPHLGKSTMRVDHVTLTPIIRHHGSFEFTLAVSEAGFVQRVRIRLSNLSEADRLHALILKVKSVHAVLKRSSTSDSTASHPKPATSVSRPESMDDHFGPSSTQSPSPLSPPLQHKRPAPRRASLGSPEFMRVYSSDNPHLSVNLLVVGLLVLSALLGPIVNSFSMTLSIVSLVGAVLAVTLRIYAVDVPCLHLIVSISPAQYHISASSFSDSPASPLSSIEASPVKHLPEGSYVEQKGGPVLTLEELEGSSNSGRSSINELGYSTPLPGSPEDERLHAFTHEGQMSVLFSESSKYLSPFAANGDYRMCYSVLWSMGEAIVRLLLTQPDAVRPPSSVRFAPSSSWYGKHILIECDDLEHTRSEWSVLRNKNGLKVLTSKISSSLTRWPIISSIATIRSPLEHVYRTVSLPDLFKRVDEFGGSLQQLHYVELANPTNVVEGEPVSESTVSSTSSGHLLDSTMAPVLVKYQEMKSIWPVQPRDYLAMQAGFELEAEGEDGRVRKGKFLLAKSIESYPLDPFPHGQEGFVRGSVTASAFLLIENESDPLHTDVWTFLHCDMKGNLSGNGKLADFITQSQMPKFFSKLETVAATLASDNQSTSQTQPPHTPGD